MKSKNRLDTLERRIADKAAPLRVVFVDDGGRVVGESIAPAGNVRPEDYDFERTFEALCGPLDDLTST